MVIDRKRKRYKQRAQAYCRHFRHRQRPGTGNQPVRLAVNARHIVNKRHHFGSNPRLRIRRLRLGQPAFAHLMQHLRTLVRFQQSQRLWQQSIQRFCPLRAAQHQQANSAAARGKTLCRRGQSGNIGAHRIAGFPPGFGMHARGCAFVGKQHAIRPARQQTVGQPRHRVLFMNQ